MKPIPSIIANCSPSSPTEPRAAAKDGKTVTRILPFLAAGSSLIDALCQIPENLRPAKVTQFRRVLSLDPFTRDFCACHRYHELILLADKFPHADLVSLARRNNL